MHELSRSRPSAPCCTVCEWAHIPRGRVEIPRAHPPLGHVRPGFPGCERCRTDGAHLEEGDTLLTGLCISCGCALCAIPDTSQWSYECAAVWCADRSYLPGLGHPWQARRHPQREAMRRLACNPARGCHICQAADQEDAWLAEAVPEVKSCLCQPALGIDPPVMCWLHRVPRVYSAEEIERAEAWLHGKKSRKRPAPECEPEAESDCCGSQCASSSLSSDYEGDYEGICLGCESD